MNKKIIISLIVSFSIIGLLPVSAQAEWKKDAYNNNVWVEAGGIKQGWNYIDNYWYYLGADGIPITGWLKDGDNWYYMWSNGTMAYDTWMTNGGFWYYFDSNGKMVTDTAKIKMEDRQYDFTQTAIIVPQYIDGSKSVSNNSQVMDTQTLQKQDVTSDIQTGEK